MRSESQFLRKKGLSKDKISSRIVLYIYILSTVETGPSVVAATRFLFRDPSLQSGLALPLANPPIERGLLSNLFFAFSRSRASRGGPTATADTSHHARRETEKRQERDDKRERRDEDISNPTSGHPIVAILDRGVQKSV